MNLLKNRIKLWRGLLLCLASSQGVSAQNQNSDGPDQPSLLSQMAATEQVIAKALETGIEDQAAQAKLQMLYVEHKVLLDERDQILLRLAKNSNVKFDLAPSLKNQLDQIKRSQRRLHIEVEHLSRMRRELVGAEREHATSDLERATRSLDELYRLKVLTQKIGLPRNSFDTNTEGRAILFKIKTLSAAKHRLETRISRAKTKNQTKELDKMKMELENVQGFLKDVEQHKLKFIEKHKRR